jgi:hypothetical protein
MPAGKSQLIKPKSKLPDLTISSVSSIMAVLPPYQATQLDCSRSDERLK